MPNRGEFRATTDQLLEIIDDLRTLEKKKQSTALGLDLRRRCRLRTTSSASARSTRSPTKS
jgi:hypothetical protein